MACNHIFPLMFAGGSVFTNNKSRYLSIFHIFSWWCIVCTYMINQQKHVTFMWLKVFINVNWLVYHISKECSLMHGHGRYKSVNFFMSHQLYVVIGF
jgi:hypothetical protein